MTANASSSPGDAGLWGRRFLWVLGGMVLLRLGYSAVFPLDLAPDESYYWDWGRRPDLGYFSKPPMVGWLMGLAGWLGNDSMFALKLTPALLSLGGVGFVFLLGRDMFGARAGFWAAVLVMATPANVALGTFFTIDAPLFLFWSASLWCAWRWWSSGTGGVRWAAGLSVALGLGYLTKQIQLVFPLLLLGFLGSVRSWKGRSMVPMGMALGVSLLFLLPPVVWNWRHDWITLAHTVSELETAPFRPARSLKFLIEFMGGQAGLGGGLTWLLLVGTVLGTASRWRTAGCCERFLVVFSLPGLAFFTGLTVQQRVEQNWPLVFYVAGFVLLAGRCTALAPPRWAATLGLRWAPGLGGALGAVLLLVPFVVPNSPLGGTRMDPTVRIRGWRELAERVEVLRRDLPRPNTTFLLGPADRYVASALAYYLPDKPRTYCWEEPGRPESQYGIWGRPLDKVGWDTLVIEGDPAAPRIGELARSFERWSVVGDLTVPLGGAGRSERSYRVYLGERLKPTRDMGDGAGALDGFPAEPGVSN